MKYNILPSSKKSYKWIIIGIPILFFIGSFFHFLYDLSGKNIIVGLIVPVNESVWEHTKMVLIPIISWWSLYYIVMGKKQQIDKDKWFTGALVALLTAIVTIPLLYYFYTEAFGVESIVVDITILFIAILFGQLLGLHFYKYSKGISSDVSIAILILIVFIFGVYTFYPPHLPIFRDGPSGRYGIF